MFISSSSSSSSSFFSFFSFFYLLILSSLLLIVNCKVSDWLYYPNTEGKVKYGIVMAATKSYFEKSLETVAHPESIYNSCIFHLYARKYGYAFYLNKDLGNVNTRKYGECSSENMSPWNKIILVKQLLPDVEYLLWVDIDVTLNEISFNVPITNFLPSSPLESQTECLPRYENISSIKEYGKNLQSFSLKNLPGSKKYPFLYASEDLSPYYPVNMNTAIFAIRNVPLAFEFLEDVWKVGDNPDYFKSIDEGWNKKFPCQGYWGWPWEQGGIWITLSNNPKKYLRNSCILSRTGKYILNNIQGDPELVALYSELSPIPDNIVFGYHHSRLSGKYILRRLLRTGSTTSSIINSTCGIFIAPVLSLKTNQKMNQSPRKKQQHRTNAMATNKMNRIN